MRRTCASAALALALSACASVPAPSPQKIAPGWVAPAQPLPTDLRRTTLIVSDFEASLAFYRDALGFIVSYDLPTVMDGIAVPAGEAGDKARFALLSTNDPWVGMLGLLAWTDPPLPEPGPYARRVGPGRIVLVIHTDRLEERCAAAAAVPGAAIAAPLREQVYQSRNGTGELKLRGCTLFDPDGNLVEINEAQG